ncbi:hypothetical protein P7K49_015487, partial [Saguinus oedipus]
EEEEKKEEKEEEEQRSRRPRRAGAESCSEDTARRQALFKWSLPFAARSGGGLDRRPGTPSASRAPLLRGHTPRGAGAAGGSREGAK